MAFNLTMSSHEEIMTVIDDTRTFEPFLLKFFTEQHLSDTQKIIWERIPANKRLAPFVLPGRQGVASKRTGSKTEYFEPAYMKPKDTVNFNQTLQRRVGERIGGELTPQQRYDAILSQMARDYDIRWMRTMEQMAGQLFNTGKIVVSGEGYPTQTIDFERNAALGAAATTLWSAGGATPVADLQKWIMSTTRPVRDILIGMDAFAKLQADPLYDKWVDKNIAGEATVMARGLVDSNRFTQENDYLYWGATAGAGVRLWTYMGTYTDDNGVEQPYVPANKVIGIPSGNFGVRCFAAIQDADASFLPLPQFFKNWVEKDPGTPYLMMQSAPLLVHTEINSTFSHQVL